MDTYVSIIYRNGKLHDRIHTDFFMWHSYSKLTVLGLLSFWQPTQTSMQCGLEERKGSILCLLCVPKDFRWITSTLDACSATF